MNNIKPTSELRFDLVSKDWVVIATGRAKRPEHFVKERRTVLREPWTKCPFCYPEETGQEKDVLLFEKGDSWSLRVFPNKYPAFSAGESLNERAEGPYSLMDGVGYHEVLVTHDHKRQMAQFSIGEIEEVVYAYQQRYLDLMGREFVNYVSIFHNHGREAGASMAHPHSQIVAIPLIDPDLHRSLQGSQQFYKVHHKCVHCVMLEWDRKDGRRIIFENEDFVVLCPFASRVAFEVRVYPKKHAPHFEKITGKEKRKLGEALKAALKGIYKALKDPAYNFFIHTAPCNGKKYDHYHWHFEILPKTAVWAGFELGTGIEISTIEPERAAEFLRRSV